MTNPYYTRTGEPVERSQLLSQRVRDEFFVVEQAFDGVSAELEELSQAIDAQADGITPKATSSITANYTTQATDDRRVLQIPSSVVAGITIYLKDAQNVLSQLGYTVFVSNMSGVAHTISRENLAQTINGVAGSVQIMPNCTMAFVVNSGNSGYLMSGGDASVVGVDLTQTDSVPYDVARFIKHFLFLEYFYDEGETNHTVAFTRAAAALNAAGMGTLNFGKNAYTVAFASGDRVLCDLDGLHDVFIKANGVVITATQSSPLTSAADIFRFTDCDRWGVEGIKLVAEDMALAGALLSSAGQRLVHCVDRNTAGHLHNLEQVYGIAILQVTGAIGTTSRTDGISMTGYIKCTGSTYDMNCQYNGDNITAENMVNSGVYRSYICYGVKHHKIFIRSENARHDDVIIGGLNGQGMEDIDITIVQVDTPTNVGASQVLISAQYGPDAGHLQPVTFRKIRVNMVGRVAATKGYQYGLRLSKADNLGAADTTDRGHIVDDVEISGSFTSANASFIPFFVGDGGVGGVWGSGENISNFRIRNFSVPSTVASSYFTPGAAAKGPVSLEHMYMPSATILATADSQPLSLNSVTANAITEGNPSTLIYVGCKIGGTPVANKTRVVGLGATYEVNHTTGQVTNTHGGTGAAFSGNVTAAGYGGDGIIRAQATNNSTVAGAYYSYSFVVGGVYRYVVDNRGDVVNTNGAYGTISDENVKSKIKDAPSKLNKVLSYSVKVFEKNDMPGFEQIGLVAQDVEKISPSLVGEVPDRDKDGKLLGTFTKYVKSSIIFWNVLKAFQELAQIVFGERDRLQALVERVDALDGSGK